MVTELKQSKSALYVEDDASLRVTLTHFIERAGYDVTQADNLQDAEGHAQRQRFDVYISDGSFPLTSGGCEVNDAGLMLYDRIRKVHGSGLNFAIVSGNENLEQECKKEGIRFFSKLKLHRELGSFTAYLESVKQTSP